MWAVWGLLLALAALILAALLVPVYARITYDGAWRVCLRVWGVPITLLPAPDKPPKAGKPKKKPRQADTPSKKEELLALFRQDGLEGTLRFLSEVAGLATKSTSRVLRAVTVDRLTLEMLIACGEAADTAVRYGQVCSVLYPALAAISGPVKVRRQHLRVEPNFLMDASDVRLDIRLHMAVYRLAGTGLWLLWRLLLLKNSDDTDNMKEDMEHGK